MLPMAVLLVWILLIVYYRGPRVPVDTRLRPLWLPDDLDSYLAGNECRIKDIIPGTEKHIVWADGSGRQTDYAMIYLHGFSATRQETAPLADRLASSITAALPTLSTITPLADRLAQKWQANLFYTRLTGHGRFDPDALLEGSVHAWLNDAHEALAIGRRLGRKVIVVGYSTGGALAAWLAAQQDQDDIAALVLLAPNFGLANPLGAILGWPWGGLLGRCLIGRTYHTDYTTPEQARYWTAAYPTRALLPMYGLVRLVQTIDKKAIRCPTLIVHATRDKIVSNPATDRLYAQMGAVPKRLVIFDDSADPNGHVLAGDLVSPHSTATLARVIDAAVSPWLGRS